jgi:putative membrane-bound dehydrogenase-like protein
MLDFALGLWIAVSFIMAGGSVPTPAPPRPLDPRLVFELIAAEPEIVTPTGLAIDHRGRILIIESHTHFRPEGYKGPAADRIRVFEDRNRDGKPECVGTFFEGTRMTMNLAVARDGSVFVATRSAVYRLEDRDGDGRADGTNGTAGERLPIPIVRLDTKGDYPHNGLSGFAFDFADNVYFGLGENLGADYRLIGSEGTSFTGGGEGGNIYRCRPDGSKLERIATGFWNPFHMAFDKFGQLFAVDNDPDSRPPCRLLHIVDGGDYGYRFRNGRKGLHPFTAWNGELPGTLGMVAGTGEAPSGVIVYEANKLPDDYRDTLLVTSWGDHRIEQYRLEPHGASFRAVMKPVVAGRDDFRPVGIAVAPDGSVYVSDWVDKSYTLHGKGRIWRLRAAPSHVGGRSPSPDAKAAIDRDRREKGRDSTLARAEALRRLADPSASEILLKALESDDPFMQQAARWGLRRSLGTSKLIAIAGSKDLSPAQRLGLLLVLRDSDRPEARALLPAFLADPDPAIHFAAIQWVGEHKLTEYRPQLLAGLASTASTRSLFEATLAALERLDGKPRNPRDELGGEDYIVALLTDPHTPATVLRRGLRMLRPDHPALTLSRLKRFLEAPEETVRIEAVRSLSQSPLPGRFAVLARLAEDHHAPVTLRAEAIVGLADDASHQRNRLLALAWSEQPVLRREAMRSLRGIPLTEHEQSLLRAANAVDDLSLELPGGLDAWLARLEGAADPDAGERVFFHSKGPGCYRCHQVDGRGSRAGPDLSTLAEGIDRSRLVQSILTPSKEIAPQFVAWSVAKTDGTVFTGILLDQSPEAALIFADSQGRLIAVKANEIAERKPQTTSIMPDNLARLMTPQEFRDLLAYLGKKIRAGNEGNGGKTEKKQYK